MALPAGIIIWLFANVEVQGITILAYVSGFLDPFAKLMGLDGVILLAFLLGFPANEIVVPLSLIHIYRNHRLSFLMERVMRIELT